MSSTVTDPTMTMMTMTMVSPKRSNRCHQGAISQNPARTSTPGDLPGYSQIDKQSCVSIDKIYIRPCIRRVASSGKSTARSDLIDALFCILSCSIFCAVIHPFIQSGVDNLAFDVQSSLSLSGFKTALNAFEVVTKICPIFHFLLTKGYAFFMSFSKTRIMFVDDFWFNMCCCMLCPVPSRPLNP